jgi:hypothetical protein
VKSFARMCVVALQIATLKKYRINKDFLHARDNCAEKSLQNFLHARVKIFRAHIQKAHSRTPKFFFTGSVFWEGAKR